MTLCVVSQDGQGKDWSERWRTVADGDGTYPVIVAWANGLTYIDAAETNEAESATRGA